MPRILTKLRIDEVSSVDKGAGEGVRVLLYKRGSAAAHHVRLRKIFEAIPFDRLQYLKSYDDDDDEPRDDDDIERTNTEDDDDKVARKLRAMVEAMIVAAPTLDRQQAAHYLLHSAHGRRLAEHLSNHLSKGENQMPQIDILKAISVMEDVLNAQVTRQPGETFAKSFSRKFESDIDFRKQWRDLSEAKQLQAYLKGLATLTPTSTGVGNTNVADDSAEAVRLLGEMATKNGRSFETEFGDPKNRALAAKTYTQHHRSSISYDAEMDS